MILVKKPASTDAGFFDAVFSFFTILCRNRCLPVSMADPEGVRLRAGEHMGTVGFDCGTKVGTRFTVRSKGDRPECRTDRRAAPPRPDADSTRLP